MKQGGALARGEEVSDEGEGVFFFIAPSLLLIFLCETENKYCNPGRQSSLSLCAD